jgi:hypothetical protein
MIKKGLILLTILCCTAGLFAQDKSFPSGGYKSLKELNAGTPSSTETFSIIRRTTNNMKDYGGNDYNIVLNNDLNTAKKVWRRYFAVVSSDTLYLNCKKLDIGVGFTPALVKGKYLAFRAYMPQGNTSANQEGRDAVIVGGPAAKNKSQFPFLWALNTATGDKTMLTYGGMMKILEPFPELKNQFMQHEEKDTDAVILEFVGKINSQ